jgi:hypothetical protein
LSGVAKPHQCHACLTGPPTPLLPPAGTTRIRASSAARASTRCANPLSACVARTRCMFGCPTPSNRPPPAELATTLPPTAVCLGWRERGHHGRDERVVLPPRQGLLPRGLRHRRLPLRVRRAHGAADQPLPPPPAPCRASQCIPLLTWWPRPPQPQDVQGRRRHSRVLGLSRGHDDAIRHEWGHVCHRVQHVQAWIRQLGRRRQRRAQLHDLRRRHLQWRPNAGRARVHPVPPGRAVHGPDGHAPGAPPFFSPRPLLDRGRNPLGHCGPLETWDGGLARGLRWRLPRHDAPSPLRTLQRPP